MSEAYGTSRPLLDARLEGGIFGTAVANDSTEFIYVYDFDALFNGVQLYAFNSNPGDRIFLSTEYNAGPYGWKRYKKFGKGWYVAPNQLNQIVLFPTYPKQGVRIKLVYENVHATNDVQFFLNLFNFVDIARVDTGTLQEGEDW